MSGALDFESVFARAQGDWLPRPRVEAAVGEATRRAAAGCCVITGEPGSGKTSLAAQWIRQNDCVHHFLRAGHTDFDVWCDPHAFFISIGFQLLERFGEQIFPSAVTIDVEGRVRDVGESGTVTGAEIGRLVSMPWRGVDVRVKLDAERVDGRAAGLRVTELVEDYRRIPLTTFREMALIDPLRQLSRLKPEARVVLWVDGLDEQPAITGSTAIADVLLNTDELRALGNLFLVLSSRPGAYLDRFMATGASRIELDDAAFVDDNREVAARYIERELARPDRADQIRKAEVTPERVRAAVLNACANNFLYLRQFFEAVNEGGLSALLNGGLPSGLEGIYQRLLGALVVKSGDSFGDRIHPVLATLAVAARGLGVDALATYSGIEVNAVKQALARLRPLLDAQRASDGATTYSLYHTSFGECVCNPLHRDELWHVDPASAHGLIARQLLADWQSETQSFSDYGIEYLPRHLARAEPAQRCQLIDLIGAAWRRAKRSHDSGHGGFVADLETAAAVAIELPFPDNIIAVAKLAPMHALVTEVERRLPDGAIELMVRLGQLQRALDALHPELEPKTHVRLIAELLRGLAATRAAATPLFLELLQRGLELCARSERSDYLLATLLEACPAMADTRLQPLLDEAVKVFNGCRQRDWETPFALRGLARLFGPLQRKSADQMFEQALEAIDQFATSSEPLLLRELLTYWAEHDRDRASELLANRKLRPVSASVSVVAQTWRLLVAAGNPDAAASIRSQLRERFLPAITDPYERARALAIAAELETEAGDAASAAQLLHQARGAAAGIGAADDPQKDYQTRRGQVTEALIAIARAAVQSDPDSAAADLEAAWRSLVERGLFNHSAFDDLVRAQWQDGPDLLEPRMSQARPTALLMAAARLRIGDTPREAAALLEEAIVSTESPDSYAGRNELLLAAAVLSAASNREQGQAWLANAALDAKAQTHWRMTVLRSMNSAGAEAAAWLEETVQHWLHRESNPNFVCELPAALRDLAQPLTAGLVQRAPERNGAKGRLLAAALGPVAENREHAAALRQQLLEPTPPDSADDSIPEYQVKAFGAGQWWAADREFADMLLRDALLALDAKFADPEQRHMRDTHVVTIFRELMRGSSEAALPFLLAHVDVPPLPNTLGFVMDGPLVPGLLGAGVSSRDLLLGNALARLAAKRPSSEDAISTLHPPTLRSIANAGAAREATAAPLNLRLKWCEAALAAAREERCHYLSCLLAAGAAEAWCAIGAKRKGLDIALATARDVLDNGHAFESIMRSAAYPHAMGAALAIMARGGETRAAGALLWEARCLGGGLSRAISYLLPVVEASRRGALSELVASNESARRLFG